MTPLEQARQEAAWKTRVVAQMTEELAEQDAKLQKLTGERQQLSTTLRETFGRMIAAFADVDFDAEACDRDEVYSLADTLIAVLHQYIPSANVSPRTAVIRDVLDEMKRQDATWGEQNHPDLYADDPYRNERYYAAEAAAWKAENAGRVYQQNTLGASKDQNCAWDGILLEEVFEALEEADPVKRRKELVQVAGVAMQWVAAIDRREATTS